MTEPVVAILRDSPTLARLHQLNREDLLAGDHAFAHFSGEHEWRQSRVPYLLTFDEGKLQLLPGNSKLLPLRVDFDEGSTAFRAQQNVRNEMVVKAVLGRDKQSLPTVIDATAGLGRDSFILAVLGCPVTMVERHPIVAALLQDGLLRYQESGDRAIAERLRFYGQDFTDNGNLDQPAVVYLDPMFPQREKSALVKKEMQIFKDMVGGDADSDRLLPVAKALASDRVVVKRPNKADFLAGVKPTYSLTGRSSRFDIYQVGSRSYS